MQIDGPYNTNMGSYINNGSNYATHSIYYKIYICLVLTVLRIGKCILSAPFLNPGGMVCALQTKVVVAGQSCVFCRIS